MDPPAEGVELVGDVAVTEEALSLTALDAVSPESLLTPTTSPLESRTAVVCGCNSGGADVEFATGGVATREDGRSFDRLGLSEFLLV